MADYRNPPVIDINLLPSAKRRPLLVFDRPTRIWLTIIAVELVGVLAFWIWANVTITRLNAQIAENDQKIAVEQAQVKEVDDLRDEAAQLQAKAELLERIKQSPLQLAEILGDLSNDTPGGIWYTNVQIARPTGAGAATLQGKASTLREVADLMLNLDQSPIFGNAILNSTTQTTQPGTNATVPGGVTFSVVGSFSPAVSGQ